MLNRLAAILVVLVGCGGATPAPAQRSTTTATAPTGLARYTIGTTSLGPITAETPANLSDLRALLNKDGLTVRPVNRSGVELHAFLGEELVFYVIPNEEDGSLFNVHVTSGKIKIEQHPEWKIGEPFTGDQHLTHCECWGAHPMCFKAGDHVAVGFDRTCDGLETAANRKVLVGVNIQRAVWSPTPFGADESADESADASADEEGGVEGGEEGGALGE